MRKKIKVLRFDHNRENFLTAKISRPKVLLTSLVVIGEIASLLVTVTL